jgi:hypothetical protein
LVRDPTEPTDLFPYVVFDTGQLTARGHVDVDSRRENRFCVA